MQNSPLIPFRFRGFIARKSIAFSIAMHCNALHCIWHCIAFSIALHRHCIALHLALHCIAFGIALHLALHCICDVIALHLALRLLLFIWHCVWHCIALHLALRLRCHCVRCFAFGIAFAMHLALRLRCRCVRCFAFGVALNLRCRCSDIVALRAFSVALYPRYHSLRIAFAMHLALRCDVVVALHLALHVALYMWRCICHLARTYFL